MQTIPRNAMSVQSRGQSCLYVSVGFGYNGGWRWPTEIEHDGEFWTYRGNQALPAEQANNWGGYAEYRRAFRATIEQTSTPIDVREVVPMFKVLRRITTAFDLAVPVTVRVPYPKECDPRQTYVTIEKLVDGNWVPGSPPSELQQERTDGGWEVLTHLDSAKDELGQRTEGIVLSYCFTEAGSYRVHFEWHSYQETQPVITALDDFAECQTDEVPQ